MTFSEGTAKKGVSQSVEGSHWLAQCVGRQPALGLMQSCLHSHYPSSNDACASIPLHKSFKDWYRFLSFPYIGQVWLPVPATRCDVMALITCNYSPSRTSALKVGSIPAPQAINYTHQKFVIPCTVITQAYSLQQ